MKLDRTGLSKTEPGQVINLMSNDVNRFDLVTLFLHYVWVTPIVVPVVSYLVWQHVQWATLASLAVIAVQTVLVQGTYLPPYLLTPFYTVGISGSVFYR